MKALRIYHKLLFCILFLSGSALCFSQESSDSLLIEEVIPGIQVETDTQDADKKIPADTAPFEERTYDNERFRKYENNPEFDYSEGRKKTKPNWFQRQLERFFNWLNDKLTLRLGEGNYFLLFKILTYVLGILLVGVLLYVLIKMTKLGSFFVRKKNKKLGDIAFDEIEKNIKEVEFDPLIADAIKAGNYRAAVRLQYLKCLRVLSDTERIEWSLEKTNRDYIYELTDANTKNKFKQLASLYEYIWYGEFDIDQKTYGQIEGLYDDFFTRSKLVAHEK